MNKKTKKIEKYLVSIYNDKLEKMFDDVGEVDEVWGTERWWGNPLSKNNGLSYISKNRINFNKTLEKYNNYAENNNKSYIRSKNIQEQVNNDKIGIPGYHTINPFRILNNIPEGKRHKNIFKKGLLSHKLGFSFKETKKWAREWWENRQDEKNDMIWTEVEKTISDAYDPKYLRQDNKKWTIDKIVLDHYTRRKPLKRRDYLHIEEVIWAIGKLFENSRELKIESWKELQERANDKLPDYAPRISRTTFYRAKKVLESNKILCFTCAYDYIHVRYYKNMNKLLGIKELGNIETIFKRIDYSYYRSNSSGSLIIELKQDSTRTDYDSSGGYKASKKVVLRRGFYFNNNQNTVIDDTESIVNDSLDNDSIERAA